VDVDVKSFFELALQLSLMRVVEDAADPYPFVRVDQHRAFARRAGEHQSNE